MTPTGCMGCRSFHDPIAHLADFPHEAAYCATCARKKRQARRLSQLLGVDVDPGLRTTTVAEGRRVYAMNEDQYRHPVLMDDGPLHPFWASPGPMPDWCRELGFIDFSEPDDEEDGDASSPTA